MLVAKPERRELSETYVNPELHKYDLTDDEWAFLRPFIIAHSKGGRPYKNARRSLNAVIFVARTGCPWRMLPSDYGNWNSAYRFFKRISDSELLEQIFNVLAERLDREELSFDSTSCKAHPQSAGAKKGGLYRRARTLRAS